VNWYIGLPDPPTEGGDSLFTYGIAALVVVIVLMLFFRKPKGPGGRR
jgi:hypothetical protein